MVQGNKPVFKHRCCRGGIWAHGLAGGVCRRRNGFVTRVVLGDELPTDVDADFINCLIIYLLYMEPVVDHMGVVEDLSGNEHHRR